MNRKTSIIDMHVHPAFYELACRSREQEAFVQNQFGLYKESVYSLDSQLTLMDAAGVDLAVLLPLDLTTGASGSLATNADVAEIVKAYPERFIGFASVDPHDPKAAEKLEKAFDSYGLSGLKLHPSKQRFYPTDPCMDDLYYLCETYRKPIVFHAGMSLEPGTLSRYARPLEFEEVALNHPDLKFCLAHFGWPWVQETCMLLLKYPNVYADTALLYFDSADEFYEQTFGVDMGRNWIDRSLRHQIMFGSDDPRLEMCRMKKAIEGMDMRQSTIDLILGGNARVFLDLEESS